MSILLGFEIPSGARVEVPSDGHLAWFGQTQLSGKSTALEALVYRGGFKAVAFITKRGEGSFLTAQQIPPYFSEPTNDAEQPLWRWVKSILEASQQRRMNFEESWIIRACEEPEHAKTLGDVHENIKELLGGERAAPAGRKRKEQKWLRKPVSGLHASVYTSLKAYFDIVMPQLARLPYTKKLMLGPGLSVMDLREYSIEMQGLVIRSVMEYVYQHERNVRVIVPEAQDFVPEHRNTPVKMACETLVRKGAADKNFMWLDAQDMAAVDKVMLRGVSILGLGVQGQSHEINRAIDALFTETKLRAADIGRLGIGQFFVRVPGGIFKKVYVQPAWMESEPHAQAIARGQMPVSSAKPMLKAFEKEREADAISRRLDPAAAGFARETDATRDDDAIRDTQTEKRAPKRILADRPAAGSIRVAPGQDPEGREEDDRMWREKYEALETDYKKLEAAHDALAEEVAKLHKGSADVPAPAAKRERQEAGKPGDAPANGHVDLDVIYNHIRTRVMTDVRLLTLLADRPEISVTIQRTTLDLSDQTLRGRLALLISEGFFSKPRTASAAFTELAERRKFRTAKPNVYRECDALANLGFLVASGDGYQAVPEMKIHIREEGKTK